MWWWVLIWVCLVLVALVYLGARAWDVWGRAKELRTEVEHASELVAALEVQVERLGEAAAAPSAVFDDPHRLREQLAVTRSGMREERRARREARMPTWARRDHRLD